MPTYGLNTDRVAFNERGGYMVKMINKTGAPSVKGTIVKASATTDFAFTTTASDEAQPIGVVYCDGVADAGECFVVIMGPAQVLITDSTAATHGNWAYTSDTTGGRADCASAAPPGGGISELTTHMQEMGHCIESKGSGTNVLAWTIVHFN